MLKLVILGAPGAGKGTQSRNLSAHFGIQQISTGDILREHMRNHTEIGEAIRELMDKGQLVPDELVVDIVKKRIADEDCKKGFILDGFPRNIAQAEILEQITPQDAVISVVVSDEVIVERMSGRLTCPKCGRMFHNHYYPPQTENTCDDCKVPLTQRADDKASTVRSRLKIYHELTEPIIEYYRKKGILIEVDGLNTVSAITQEILERIRGRCNGHIN